MLFKDTLKRSNKQLTDDRADRIVRTAKSEYDDTMRQLVKKLDDLDAKADQLQDLSATVDMTNAARILSFDAAKWVREFNSIENDRFLTERELVISDGGYKKLFGESYIEKNAPHLVEVKRTRKVADKTAE